MSHFAAGKNPPWARPAGGLMTPNLVPPGGPFLPHQQSGGTPHHPGFSMAGTAPGQPHFSTAQMAAVALQQSQLQHGNSVLPQPSIAIPTSLGASVAPPLTYPNIRPNQPPQPQQQQQSIQQQPKQRVFTGKVTKLLENFGFVDEDVFFQKSCVKGTMPKAGERVLVEATYNPSMPFKWNATRIQVLPNQSMVSAGNSTPNSAPSPSIGTNLKPSTRAPHMPQSGPLPLGVPTSSAPIQRNAASRRDNLKYEKDKERRERQRQLRKRSRSPPVRRQSPQGRTRSPVRKRPAKVTPRYVVQTPKLSLDVREANVVTLKSRYSNMYIPSDFFNAKFSWTDAFPHTRPFELGHACRYHIMHKDVEPLQPDVSQSEPNDLNHKYSAKVMLLSSPTLKDIYASSCSLAEDGSENKFQHPTRLLPFLVGLRGKGEPMAIGGPWSPSLDGPNPEEDPSVLINTAIRSTKALTGIDLGNCTKWYRFTEIRYQRPEEIHKGRVTPARVETVVIFLPDVWSCCPSQLEWEGLQAAYKKHLLAIQSQQEKTQAVSQEGETETVDEDQPNPSHFSDLDPRSMKLVDLRGELESRSLSVRGLRSQLIARLTKALKAEQEKEEESSKTDDTGLSEVEAMVKKEEVEPQEVQLTKEEEDKKIEEKQKKSIQAKRYLLPENPSIIVHPSSTAKGGKFDCTIMSLSLLLDYRQEDNKEHLFEVSLFAELFNEMLMRDLSYCIYKALAAAPEKSGKEIVDVGKALKIEGGKETGDVIKEPVVKKSKFDESEKIEEDKKGEKPSTVAVKDTSDDDVPIGEKVEEEAGAETKEMATEDEGGKEKDEGIEKKEAPKEKALTSKEKKKYTIKPDLLLSFVYFDQNHTGYLLDKDIEEILHTAGLQLSRAQARKLSQKLAVKGCVHYRKLTDGVENTDEESNNTNHGHMFEGNLPFLRPPTREESVEGSEVGVKSVSNSVTSNMVSYKGAIVDIKSILQQLEKSEKARGQLESRCQENSKELGKLKTKYRSVEEKKDEAEGTLESLRSQLDEKNAENVTLKNQIDKMNQLLTKTKTFFRSMEMEINELQTVAPATPIKKEK